KKANELMAHTYSHLYGIPTTGLRFFTVYGPWGRPDMALFKFTKAMLEGKSIDVYNYGKMKRDFTYIDDIVEAVQQLRDDGVCDDYCDGAHDYDRNRCRQVRDPELALVVAESGDSSMILRRHS
ncbi:NAD-dependent epimerase/dehydratase family protein, partial [Postechiella marina]|uniref:NAD-dependent epimerase/dehydratase family protein n=1 Tax=Postechiella marina TaxID=943941 RepID=UPI0031D46F4A